jgi:hypothetical protein
MTYSLRRFEFPSSNLGPGNSLAEQVDLFLSLNLGITVVKLSVNWREGRSRGANLYLNLLYRGGGTLGRTRARAFQSTLTTQAEDEANAFFAANPGFIPVQTVVLSRPDVVPRNRRLLVLFASVQDAQVACLRNAPVGVPGADVPQGAYGLFWDDLDLLRNPLPALNLGNTTWPDGGANLLFRSVDSSPSMCAWGGIAPCSYPGPPFDAPPILEPAFNCDPCIPADLLTISYTATFPPPSTTAPPSTTPPYPPVEQCGDLGEQGLELEYDQADPPTSVQLNGDPITIGAPGCCYLVTVEGFLTCQGWTCSNDLPQQAQVLIQVLSGQASLVGCGGEITALVAQASIPECPEGPVPVSGQFYICGEVSVRATMSLDGRCFPGERFVAETDSSLTFTLEGPCTPTTTTPPPPQLSCVREYTSTWDCNESVWGPAVFQIGECVIPGEHPFPLNEWLFVAGDPCVATYFRNDPFDTCTLMDSCEDDGDTPSPPDSGEPDDCCPETTTTTSTTPPPAGPCGGLTPCPGGSSSLRGSSGINDISRFRYSAAFTYDGYGQPVYCSTGEACFSVCLNVSPTEAANLMTLSEGNRTLRLRSDLYDCDGSIILSQFSDPFVYDGSEQFCFTHTFPAFECPAEIGAESLFAIEATAAFDAELTTFNTERICWAISSSECQTGPECDETSCDICTATCTSDIYADNIPFGMGFQSLTFQGITDLGSGVCSLTWSYVDGSDSITVVITVDTNTQVATGTATATDGVNTCQSAFGSAEGLLIICGVSDQQWGLPSTQIDWDLCPETTELFA